MILFSVISQMLPVWKHYKYAIICSNLLCLLWSSPLAPFWQTLTLEVLPICTSHSRKITFCDHYVLKYQNCILTTGYKVNLLDFLPDSWFLVSFWKLDNIELLFLFRLLYSLGVLCLIYRMFNKIDCAEDGLW